MWSLEIYFIVLCLVSPDFTVFLLLGEILPTSLYGSNKMTPTHSCCIILTYESLSTPVDTQTLPELLQPNT